MKLYFAIGAALLLCGSVADSPAQTGLPPLQVSLPVRSFAQMEPADAEVVAAHKDAIARAAAFYDFHLDSSWSYEQAVCPLTPQHILLNYYSRQRDGVSSFSAVVPRQGSVIRIVPLVHDGTAPSVVPWGEHSYNVFNAMTAGSGGVRQRKVSSDQSQRPASLSPGDQFVWGLCYVALVNERALIAHPDSELHVFSATEPTFRLGTQGGSELSFTVRDDAQYYSVWQLEFSREGGLIHADRDQHMLPTSDMETATSVVPEGAPVTQSALPIGTPVATGTASVGPEKNRAQTPAEGASAGSSTTPNRTVEHSVGATSVERATSHASQNAAVAVIPTEDQPTRRAKKVKSDVHVIPEAVPSTEHAIPDSGPPVTHPVPQG